VVTQASSTSRQPTAAALAEFVMRGIECGAIDADEVLPLGVDLGRLADLARRKCT